MKNFSTSLLLLLLLGCNNEQKKSESSTQKDSVVNTNNVRPTDNVNAVFSLGSFDKKNTLLKDSVKGTIIDGANWTDADGTFTVVLGQTENKMVNGGQSQRIYAY